MQLLESSSKFPMNTKTNIIGCLMNCKVTIDIFQCPYLPPRLNFQYEPNMAIPVQLPVPVFALQVITVCLNQVSEIDTDSNWGDLFQLICAALQLFRESLGGDLRLPYLLDLWNLVSSHDDMTIAGYIDL